VPQLRLALSFVALGGEALHPCAGARIVAPVQGVVTLFGQHLSPVPALDRKQVERLVADLDRGTFRQRRAAAKELVGLGQAVTPLLRRASAKKPPIEVRKRLEEILEEIARRPASADELRRGRAVLALEVIGTPAARALLKKLAGGEPAAPLTREAASTLARLVPSPH